MNEYSGSCHCGAIRFTFSAQNINSGLRCNCSICRRRGAVMSDFFLPSSELDFADEDGLLKIYQFGTSVARHYFCSRCGIYPFHETMRMPGHYRVNLGCVEGIDAYALPCSVFDGKGL